MSDFISLLPECLQDVVELQQIENQTSSEADTIRAEFNNIQSQKFVQTATDEGLSLWEKEYGIENEPGNDDIARREIITAKIRGTGTTTKQLIKDMAQAFSGSEATVVEVPEEYKFIIKFVGTIGIPKNMTGLTKAIEEIKPAHLGFEYKYTFNTWDMVKKITWNYAKTMTWDELKSMKLEVGG